MRIWAKQKRTRERCVFLLVFYCAKSREETHHAIRNEILLAFPIDVFHFCAPTQKTAAIVVFICLWIDGNLYGFRICFFADIALVVFAFDWCLHCTAHALALQLCGDRLPAHIFNKQSKRNKIYLLFNACSTRTKIALRPIRLTPTNQANYACHSQLTEHMEMVELFWNKNNFILSKSCI